MARRFSQRNGYIKVGDAIQLESLNKESRMAIWNCLYVCLFDNRNLRYGAEPVAKQIWIHFLNEPADAMPHYNEDMLYIPSQLATIKSHIMDGLWYEVYDLIEYILEAIEYFNDLPLDNYLNSVFRNFNVGYTVVNGFVTPVTSEEEVKSIQDAIDNSPKSSSLHFVRALELMTDREQPDYRNSIKESISAIESICKRIASDDKGTLGDCLKVVENQSHIHPAMKRAFMQLYGYTSDQGGIRHALSDDSVSPTLEDARFMLITCSAFNNYLLSKVAD